MKYQSKNRLILEFTEFNAQRLNPDSAQMSVHVDNPQLSINAFDKHEDAIRAGIGKINSILHSLANTSSFRSLKSKLSLENQKIESMKVLRITKSNEVNYDAYITFVIDGEEYYGVIEDLMGKYPTFTSEVFKDSDLIQSKEWVIRTRGLVIKTVKTWMLPDKGIYKLENDVCYITSNETGELQKIEKGDTIEVISSRLNNISVRYQNKIYSLRNDNFVYFNWWFIKED